MRSLPRRIPWRIPANPGEVTSPPAIGKLLLAGAGLGLLWGVVSRLWMRLIAEDPAFTAGGTVFVLLIPTIFGACTALALAARQRDWEGWRAYLPRALAVVSFIPHGAGGGSPLMGTVLLASLAVTQAGNPVVLIVLAALIAVALAASGSVAAGSALAGVVILGAILWRALRALLTITRLEMLQLWLSCLMQILLIMLAAGLVVFIAWETARTIPPSRSIPGILIYVPLLYPLFLALRVALEPRSPAREPDALPGATVPDAKAPAGYS